MRSAEIYAARSNARRAMAQLVDEAVYVVLVVEYQCRLRFQRFTVKTVLYARASRQLCQSSLLRSSVRTKRELSSQPKLILKNGLTAVKKKKRQREEQRDCEFTFVYRVVVNAQRCSISVEHFESIVHKPVFLFIYLFF